MSDLVLNFDEMFHERFHDGVPLGWDGLDPGACKADKVISLLVGCLVFGWRVPETKKTF